MASLGSLEVELLALILEYVDDEDPQSTPNFALTNRHIYFTSRPVSHRRKNLHFDGLDDIDGVVTKWLDNPEIMRGCRHVTITSTLPEGDYDDSTPQADEITSWRPFVDFISQASRLKTLIWKYRATIPLEILNALHTYHPNLQLKVYNFSRRLASADHTDPAERVLASSPLLVGLNAKIWCTIGRNLFDFRECAFRRIVANAPNLRYCSIMIDDPSMSGHCAGEKEKIEKFYKHKEPNSSVKTLTLDGYPLSKSTLDDWAKFVNLSSIENIKCLRGGRPSIDYFPHALKVLPNLKHLSLNLRFNQSKDFRAAVFNFIQLCPLLETLSLWSWMGTVKLDTILRHGPTLRVLALHEREDGMGQKILGDEEVKAIREACPNIRDLTIDMRRESRKLYAEPRNDAISEELALFGPQLDRIQIYFDLGVASLVTGTYDRLPGEDDSSSDEDAEEDEEYEEEIEVYQDDYDDSDEDVGTARGIPSPFKFKLIKPSKARYIEKYIEEMWAVIFGGRVTGPRQLDVKFGEWEQKVGVGMQGRVQGYHALERSLKSFWTVRPKVRDDERTECVVKRHSLVG